MSDRSMSEPAAQHKADVALDDVGSMAGHAHSSRFSALSILGLAFAILNSWVAGSASLSVVLVSGGPVAMLWGFLISFIGVMCIAASMAEICAILPCVGGPYHWTFALAPPKHRIGLAYVTGWLNASGWICLVATASSLGAAFITGIIALFHENYEVQSWHTLVLYIAFSLGGWTVNVFGARVLDAIGKFAFLWSLTGAVLVCIVCLSCASPTYRSGTDVFGTFVNETGWNGFVCFMLGLLQSTFSLVGTDAVTHLVLEMPRAHVTAPRAMLLAPILGTLSSFIVLMVLLFCLTDYEAVYSSATGPLLTIFYQATGSRGGSTALLMFPVLCMAGAAIALLTASSRTTQALAADRGIPLSAFFASETKGVNVPVPAITLNTFFVIVFGCVYLGSTAALNAILSASVVLVQLSYSVPVMLLLVRGRKLLDEVSFHVGPRHFNLGKFGYVVNAFGVFFAIFTTIFFIFPSAIPVDSTSMNYTVVVAFGVVPLLAGLSWIFHGRMYYDGPRNLDLALEIARRGLTDADRKSGLSGRKEEGAPVSGFTSGKREEESM